MIENKIRKEHKVTFDNVDFRNKLKPSAIFRFFQESAQSHAQIMGCDYETLKKKI